MQTTDAVPKRAFPPMVLSDNPKAYDTSCPSTVCCLSTHLAGHSSEHRLLARAAQSWNCLFDLGRHQSTKTGERFGKRPGTDPGSLAKTSGESWLWQPLFPNDKWWAAHDPSFITHRVKYRSEEHTSEL